MSNLYNVGVTQLSFWLAPNILTLGVGEVDWLYKYEFCGIRNLPIENLNFDLLFEGLDTCATVWFNGHRIYQSDNAFMKHRIPVTELYMPHSDNVLVIHFAAAFMHGKDLE